MHADGTGHKKTKTNANHKKQRNSSINTDLDIIGHSQVTKK